MKRDNHALPYQTLRLLNGANDANGAEHKGAEKHLSPLVLHWDA